MKELDKKVIAQVIKSRIENKGVCARLPKGYSEPIIMVNDERVEVSIKGENYDEFLASTLLVSLIENGELKLDFSNVTERNMKYLIELTKGVVL